MTQLTVRGIDSVLHEMLKTQAKLKGMSVNSYVLEILREALGQVEPGGDRPLFHDLDHLAGTWSTEQASEFEQTLTEQRQIDETLWS